MKPEKLSGERLREAMIAEANSLREKNPKLRWAEACLKAKRKLANEHGMDQLTTALKIG